MTSRFLLALFLAATLMVPAAAQQTAADSQQSATSSSQNSSQSSSQAAATTTGSQLPGTGDDQNMSAHQPLEPELHQGFWGKMNPFARKKYVQQQLTPIRNRVNELDDLTAANSKAIKDVDARAQEGIRMASAKANEADQHAIEAGNHAQQANQTATQASTRLNTVEQVVGSIDQYQPATQTEIRFRPGTTALSTKAKQAIDDMAANLKDQKGYIVEVQGFSPTPGQAGVQTSQAMANSVVRYLVERHQIPVYRIFVLGMGNAKGATSNAEANADTEPGAKPYHGNRVEVSLLKNNVDQLASLSGGSNEMNQPSSRPSHSAPRNNTAQTSSSGHASSNGAAQQPGNVSNTAPVGQQQTLQPPQPR